MQRRHDAAVSGARAGLERLESREGVRRAI